MCFSYLWPVVNIFTAQGRPGDEKQLLLPPQIGVVLSSTTRERGGRDRDAVIVGQKWSTSWDFERLPLLLLSTITYVCIRGGSAELKGCENLRKNSSKLLDLSPLPHVFIFPLPLNWAHNQWRNWWFDGKCIFW